MTAAVSGIRESQPFMRFRWRDPSTADYYHFLFRSPRYFPRYGWSLSEIGQRSDAVGVGRVRPRLSTPQGAPDAPTDLRLSDWKKLKKRLAAARITR